jgi:predicted ATPase
VTDSPYTSPEPAQAFASGASPVAVAWQVRLLGGIRAESALGVIDRWPTRAVACLLARLALSPRRAHPREELIDLLWPGADPAAGRPRLRQALSQLRSLLEPPDATWPALLLADRQAVRLAPGTLDCDALQFERSMAAGDHARAARLYTGELMPGHYDEWVLLERRRLEDLAATLQAPCPVPAGPAPRRAPASAAVAGAADTGLGLPPPAPGPRATDAGGARAVGALPNYWTRAFGTEQTTARLRGLVVTQRLVTVLGPGGSGKTRLAGELAQALVEPAGQPSGHCPFERVLYASLTECRDAEGVMEVLMRLARPAGAGDPGARLADWLDAAPTLAVLDNVEQFDESAAELVERLLHAAPSLHVLLTSRRRLGLDGERVFELPGLALALPEAAIAAALASPAVALFVDRARASRPEFHLTAANVEPVVALTRLLGGMPLAIELAASRLRALQPAELLARLREGAGSPLLDLLARPAARAGAQSRHASMRHVVAWSWQQLRPELAVLLRGLSVLQAPASAEVAAWAFAALDAATDRSAAADAAAAGAPAPPRVQALLAEALESSLLRAWPDDAGQTLYGLLPPVREYAAEQCSADEPRRVRQALRRALIALAQSPDDAQQQRLAAAAAHAVPLFETAPADDALTEALELAVTLRLHWNQQRPSALVMAVLDQAIAAADDPDKASRACLVLGTLWMRAAHPERTRALAERALGLAPNAARRAQAQALRAQAAAYMAQDPDAIDGWLREALQDAEASGSDAPLLDVLRAQATMAVNLREDYVTAVPLVERCLAIYERQGDLPRLRSSQIDLAACLGWTGREAEAAALLETCIATSRRADECVNIVMALWQLGRVRLRMRQAAEAATAFETAARRALHTPGLLLYALLHLPEAWVMTGRAEPAALLHGHITAAWLRQMGPINRIEAREVRRGRRLIVHALGAARAAELFETGRAITQAQALALLPPEAAATTATA